MRDGLGVNEGSRDRANFYPKKAITGNAIQLVVSAWLKRMKHCWASSEKLDSERSRDRKVPPARIVKRSFPILTGGYDHVAKYSPYRRTVQGAVGSPIGDR